MQILLLALLVAAPLIVFAAAQLPPSPVSWEGFKMLGPVLVIALLGGMVAFISKVRSGATRIFNFTEFIGDMFISSVAGMFFYWLCRGFEINEWITAAITGMAGHAGSRALFIIEKWCEKKLDELKIAK